MISKMRVEKIRSFYKIDYDEEEEEDEVENLVQKELENCNRTKGTVKIFNQECVICLENPSVYAFRQCGHQCEGGN